MYLQTNFKKSNKYKAETSVYNGNSYHSRAEAEYAMGLDDDLKSGRIKSWTRQVKIEINVVWEKNNNPVLVDKPALELKQENKKFLHICNYFMDFVVENLDNSVDYCEIKGVETGVWRLKFKLCEAIFKDHATINLKVIKVNSSWRNYKPINPK